MAKKKQQEVPEKRQVRATQTGENSWKVSYID